MQKEPHTIKSQRNSSVFDKAITMKEIRRNSGIYLFYIMIIQRINCAENNDPQEFVFITTKLSDSSLSTKKKWLAPYSFFEIKRDHK